MGCGETSATIAAGTLQRYAEWTILCGMPVEPIRAAFSPVLGEEFTNGLIEQAQRLDEVRKSGGPALPRRIANYGQALARHLVKGSPVVTDSEYQARLSECSTCILQIGEICAHPTCGCPLERAALWATKDCPIYRWKKNPDIAVEAAEPQVESPPPVKLRDQRTCPHERAFSLSKSTDGHVRLKVKCPDCNAERITVSPIVELLNLAPSDPSVLS